MKRLYVIGSPISHSLSPIIHNAGLRELGLENEFSYERMEVDTDGLLEFMGKVRAGEIHGASVTMPNKISILHFMDDLTKEAKSIGAVNTVYLDYDRITGHNTDGGGFLKALEEEDVSLAEKRMILLGAGGSARSIAMSLAGSGISALTIVNRTLTRAEELTRMISASFDVKTSIAGFEELAGVVKEADIIVNTIPGVENGTPLLSAEDIPSGIVVNDIVYKALNTPLMGEAEKAGARVIPGTGMLLHQAAEQFELFTGHEAPVRAMREALMEALNEIDGQ